MFFISPEKEIIEILEKGPIFKKKLIAEAAKLLKFTPQSVYRVINKLLERNIIIENQKKISISGSFIAQLREYYVKLSKLYHQEDIVKDLLPKLISNNKESFVFNGYVEFNIFWEHVGVLLKKTEKTEKRYVFIEPFAYWFRYTKNQSVAYIKLLQSYGYHIVWLIKPITTDQESKDIAELRSMGVEVVFDDSLDITKSYNFFDNYLIEATYDDSWVHNMFEAYKLNVSQDTADIILNSQSTFRLQVYKDSKKQEKWWNRIKKEII